MKVMFLDWIIARIINNWGICLYDTFKSFWIVILLFIIIFISFYYLISRVVKVKKTRIIFLIMVFLVYFLLIVIPFSLGQKHSELRTFGFKVVEVIENTQRKTKSPPKNIDEIAVNFTTENERNYLRENFFYEFIDHIEYNKKLKDQTGLLYNDDYILEMHPHFMWSEFYRYDEKSKKFIITD
jgi:predicted PurR-regulated permease PerM